MNRNTIVVGHCVTSRDMAGGQHLVRVICSTLPDSLMCLAIATLLLFLVCPDLKAAANDNLLDESGWTFHSGLGRSLSSEGQIDGVLAWSQKNGTLSIRKLEDGAKLHVWWLHKLRTKPGETYHLSFQAKGWGESNHSVYAGVDFRGDDGTYTTFKELRKVCYRNPVYPGATVADKREWKTYEADFTAPPGVSTLSLRMALGGSGSSEAAFRNVVLTKPAIPLSEAFARLPERIPVEAIPLDPVAASGVSLTPVWDTEGAERKTSRARYQLCLNGLWAIQPGDDFSAPIANDWGFMKVPSALIPGTPYFVYNQDKTTWAKKNLYKQAEAVWFVRDVAVPRLPGNMDASGTKVWLDIRAFRGFALVVYWNGKRVGMLTGQQGDRLDLTGVVQPGESGQLAIYALALPPESKYAYLMQAGAMPRLYDSTRFTREKNRSLYNRGISDVYMVLQPAEPIFEAVRAVPSTRNRQLGITFRNATDAPVGLTYALTVRDADGAVALEKRGLKPEHDGVNWTLTVPWENPRLWSPDEPYLYSFSVMATNSDGAVVDETLPASFGFREVWVDGKNLMMNGQPLRLRPRLSMAFFMDGEALRRQFSALKDMGFNCILRPQSGTTHQQESWEQNSRADYFGVADEVGMLLIPYTPYNLVSRGQFGTAGGVDVNVEELLDYIRKVQIEPLANHPSVIAYSGFGGGFSEGINYVNPRPDIWGVSPAGDPDVLRRILSSPANRKRAEEMIRASEAYVEGIKELDPSRPFLSHLDTGQGDGWGMFDYFNWTPVQEWEDWPKAWAEKGIMPIGSTEHGLPYPSSFLNHAIPDGDYEPWVTEYSAMILGPAAYADEPSEYLEMIRRSFNKNTGTYLPKSSAHHSFAEIVISKNLRNVQAVWAENNKAIYRAWRTYGVPMGIEPFGRTWNLVDPDYLMKGDGAVMAKPGDELRTTGAKLDSWNYNGYWPGMSMPVLPMSPTGNRPTGLTLLGATLYEVNRPLLAYVAGSESEVTAKDHVFTSEERVAKQIVVVWDGFTDRSLNLIWSVTLDGKSIAEENVSVSLPGGSIYKLPIFFTAQDVNRRTEGTIELTVKDAQTEEIVAHDRFDFQVYPELILSEATQEAKIVIFDPSGESVDALKWLGLNPIVISNLSAWEEGDIFVVGRNSLAALRSQSLDAVPSDVPILVLEQNVDDLESLGFRTFPTRTRKVFPLPEDHTVLNGVGAPDLRDWRVCPTLLPTGVTPLRDGYNYHTDYYGAVASVTIETPTKGNFTPLLVTGFDLRETPLLEATINGRRWLFNQLSVIDAMPGSSPVAGDPVGARILANLITYLSQADAPSLVSIKVLGDQADVELARTLGSSVISPAKMADLGPKDIVLAGKVGGNALELRQWVREGGTAVVLPQDLDFYATAVPMVDVNKRKASLSPVPNGSAFQGLGQADFHYRQELPLLTFDGDFAATELADDEGRWILLGFDPRQLDLVESPWLRLTVRHQYRALAQVLTNVGADLPYPSEKMVDQFVSTSLKLDVADIATACIQPTQLESDTTWTMPSFDDSSWEDFGLSTQVATVGDAIVRIVFTIPEGAPLDNVVADLGTMDDYDETWLNGVKIGSINPGNSQPGLAWKTPRLYLIPDGLLKSGQENVLVIRVWNRNASKGVTTRIRGPMILRTNDDGSGPYVGDYRHSDDPYLEHHW